MVFHCLLGCMFSDEKPAFILTFVLLFVVWFLSSSFFKMYSLSLFYWGGVWVCVCGQFDYNVSWFYFLHVFSAWGLLSFLDIIFYICGRFLVLIFSSIFSGFSSPPPFSETPDLCMLGCMILSHSSLMVSSFFKVFPFSDPFWIVSNASLQVQ